MNGQHLALEDLLPPAAFTLDARAFQSTDEMVFTGPSRGDVMTSWMPDGRGVEIFVEVPQRGVFTPAEARQLRADLDAVLDALADCGVDR